LRYRANNCPPPGRKICAFCGSTRNVEIHHVDGHEEHPEQRNLAWACRSCNTKIGVVFKQVGLGRRTRQFNPPSTGATSLGQWVTAVMSMKGESGDMDVEDAVEMIRATPPERRSRFAQEIWRIRRERGTDRSVPF
jgi:hypothetical protein